MAREIICGTLNNRVNLEIEKVCEKQQLASFDKN